MSTGNQSRDITDDQTSPVFVFDDTDLRVQGSKRIRGNLRACFRDSGQQRRLSRIRKSDKSDVGQHPKLEQELSFLTRLTGLGKAWSLASRGGEVSIAQPSTATLAKNKLASGFREINYQFLLELPAIDCFTLAAVTKFRRPVITGISQARTFTVAAGDLPPLANGS
jgi:hypothetical protein